MPDFSDDGFGPVLTEAERRAFLAARRAAFNQQPHCILCRARLLVGSNRARAAARALKYKMSALEADDMVCFECEAPIWGDQFDFHGTA